MSPHDPRVRTSRITIPTPDGAELTACLARHLEVDSHGTLLIAPAVAVPQGFYARFAAFAASRGLRALTFDYRHFGRSRKSPGPRATLSRWGEVDYPAVLRWALARFPDQPLYVVGHSLGGQFLGMADQASRIAGAAAIASMSGYVDNLEHDRLRAQWMFRYVVPATSRALDEVPGWMGLGVAAPSSAMRQWARWCLNPDYFLAEHPEYAQRIASFRRPMTLISFTDDRIAPLVNVRWLVDFYAAAKPHHVHFDPQRERLPGIGHLGFFRESSRPLWASLLRQLRDHDRQWVPTPEPEPGLADIALSDLRFGAA